MRASRLHAVDLTQQLAYLLRRAHFEAEGTFVELFDALDITPRQAAVLLTVAQNPGISQAILSDRVALDANTLSDIISRMLRKQLIRRERSATDKRSYGLQVTDPGKRQLAQFLPGVDKYQRRVGRRLSADQRGQLIVLLQRLLGFETSDLILRSPSAARASRRMAKGNSV